MRENSESVFNLPKITLHFLEKCKNALWKYKLLSGTTNVCTVTIKDQLGNDRLPYSTEMFRKGAIQK